MGVVEASLKSVLRQIEGDKRFEVIVASLYEPEPA